MRSYTLIVLAGAVFFIHAANPPYASGAQSIYCPENYAAATQSPLSTATQNMLGKICWSCVENAFSGFKSSLYGDMVDTLGAVKSGVGNAVDCALSPIQCAKAVGEKVRNVLGFLGNVVQTFVQAFGNLSLEAIGTLICNFIGAFGASTLKSIVLGAVGIGAVVMSILSKIKLLAPLLSLVKLANVPLEYLAKLKEKTLERIHQLLGRKDGQKELEMILKSCHAAG
jgi:hypothetical protein